MDPTAPSADQLSRTGRAITSGIWVCASITMLASLINGTSVFHALTGGDTVGTAVGFLTALAVDACLVVVLCGDRQMQALGLTAAWGRVLRIVTLFMSLGLNCGASIYLQHYGLAAFHAFLPMLIVGMSEYGQEVMLKFTSELREREAERRGAEEKARNEQRAVVDADAAKRTRIAEESATHGRKMGQQRALTAEAKRTAEETERQALAAERLRAATEQRAEVARSALAGPPRLVVDNTRKAGAGKSASPVQDRAIAWLADQRRDGRDLDEVGPAEVARELDASINTVKKGLPKWRAIVSELTEAAG